MESSATFLAISLTIAFASAAMHQQASETLNMEVYYASVGKASEEFITKQLYPTYVAVNKGYLPMHPPLKVELIPYGNCTGRAVAASQRKTCTLNKVHACAISLSRNENNWTPLNYVNCLMTRQHEAYDDPPLCAVKTCFDDRAMAACVNTVDGDRLMSTPEPDVDLPRVTFDGAYDEGEQERARTNLLSLVCEKTGRVAAACRTARANETMTHDNFGSGFYYPERIHCYFWVNNWHW